MTASPPRPPQALEDDDYVPRVLNSPERIWLVYGDIDRTCEASECEEVTWCQDKQYEPDIEYVLADLLRTEREGRQAAERDAARYRWLRDAKKSGVGYPMVAKVNTYGSYLDWNALIDGSLDTAIDAALAHSTGGKP